MKIQVMSDTHLEWHRDGGTAFLSSLDFSGVDVLVLAGDIASANDIPHVAQEVCSRVANVVYVAGNHEYYGRTCDDVEAIRASALPANFHWLHNSSATINGQRFLGGTMWFRRQSPPDVISEAMWSDFRHITGLRDWVDRESQATHTAIRDARPDDVVVTHYLPAEVCVSPRWKQHRDNCYFVSDSPMLGVPKLWIHGHTHDSVDLMERNTRVVCNPFGYVGYQLNAGFVERKVIEV